MAPGTGQRRPWPEPPSPWSRRRGDRGGARRQIPREVRAALALWRPHKQEDHHGTCEISASRSRVDGGTRRGRLWRHAAQANVIAVLAAIARPHGHRPRRGIAYGKWRRVPVPLRPGYLAWNVVAMLCHRWARERRCCVVRPDCRTTVPAPAAWVGLKWGSGNGTGSRAQRHANTSRDTARHAARWSRQAEDSRRSR